MGSQIRIAQSRADEMSLNRLLTRKFDLLCLPWRLTRADPVPVSLDECDGGAQIIFASELRATVLANVSAIEGEETAFQIFPRGGLFLEWSRSELGGGTYSESVYSKTGTLLHIPGRYYLDTDARPEHLGALATMRRVFQFIVRTIKKTHPKKSTDPHPTFVGPDVAGQIERGEVRLCYGNKGGDLSLVDN